MTLVVGTIEKKRTLSVRLSENVKKRLRNVRILIEVMEQRRTTVDEIIGKALLLLEDHLLDHYGLTQEEYEYLVKNYVEKDRRRKLHARTSVG